MGFRVRKSSRFLWFNNSIILEPKSETGVKSLSTLNKKRMLLIILISLGCVLQVTMDYVPVQAALKVPEVLTVEEPPAQGVRGKEHSSNFSDNNGEESKLLSEKLLQRVPERSAYQLENATRLQLKSPGKLPGIELGVEMHSLQAFQSVIPPETLPQGWDFKQEQPVLLPPSINAPDYNGGFLRFTW